MLIATQYDYRWNEEFSGWDFYDISQCVVFRENGYKVVVPCTDVPFAFHAEGFSAPIHYDHEREHFCQYFSKQGYRFTGNCLRLDSNQYAVMLQKRDLFLEKMAKGIAVELSSEKTVEEICRYAELIYEIAGKEVVDHQCRLLLVSLSICSEDFVSVGDSLFWPLSSIEESMNLLNNLVFLIWRVEYDYTEENWYELNNFVKTSHISRKGIKSLIKSVCLPNKQESVIAKLTGEDTAS